MSVHPSPPVSRLSVLIPALNEQDTLAAVVDAVAATGHAHEIIVIDDGSTDGSQDVISGLERAHPGLVRSVHHPARRGKGAAIRSGLALATGDLILIQDADREYDPADLPALLAPFDDPKVSVVYGSRNLRPNPRSSFTYYWGGRLLSAVANALYGTRITDESCGYKVIRADLLRSLALEAEGFDFCAELTGKLLALGTPIREVPVSYRPRSFAEGKKIRWRDGAIAIGVLARLWFTAPGDVPRRGLAVAALLTIAALCAYSNSFGGAFVFDDHGAILDNPTIRRLWPPQEVLSPPNQGLPVTGRPLTNLSFALNHAVHGNRVAGYHAVNVALHIGGALLLFGVLRRTLAQPALRGRFVGRAAPLAATVALLWVVHPLQTAAVTYISQRAESLATAFILLAWYAFVRGAEERSAPERQGAIAASRRGWMVLSATACWLAVGMKEIAFAIPLLIALYDRAFFRDTWRGVLSGRPVFYGVLFASWLLLGGLILSTENRGGTWAASSGFTPWEYARLQCEAIVHYLRLVFWPAPLVFDYGRNLPVPGLAAIVPHAALIGGLLAAAMVSVRRWPAAALLGAVFFLVLAPTSSFVPIADPVFEHRMYLPSAAVITGLVLLAGRVLGRWAAWLIVPCAVVLCAATFQRNTDYCSALALWQDTVAKRPDNARARGNLGEVLTRLGRPAEALPHFEAAHRLTPQLPLAAHNLANCLDLLGRREEAIGFYREALALQPRNTRAQTNLANALAESGAIEEALALGHAAVESEPSLPEAHRALGRVLLRAGRTAEAIDAFRRAAELRPDDAEYQFNLGDALARERRLPEAIVAFEAAVRLRPDYREALNNLGNALLLTKRVPEAIAAFERALRVKPDPMTHTNLGVALLLERRREEAISQFEAALKLDPSYGRARSLRERLQP